MKMGFLKKFIYGMILASSLAFCFNSFGLKYFKNIKADFEKINKERRNNNYLINLIENSIKNNGKNDNLEFLMKNDIDKDEILDYIGVYSPSMDIPQQYLKCFFPKTFFIYNKKRGLIYKATTTNLDSFISIESEDLIGDPREEIMYREECKEFNNFSYLSFDKNKMKSHYLGTTTMGGNFLWIDFNGDGTKDFVLVTTRVINPDDGHYKWEYEPENVIYFKNNGKDFVKIREEPYAKTLARIQKRKTAQSKISVKEYNLDVKFSARGYDIETRMDNVTKDLINFTYKNLPKIKKTVSQEGFEKNIVYNINPSAVISEISRNREFIKKIGEGDTTEKEIERAIYVALKKFISN